MGRREDDFQVAGVTFTDCDEPIALANLSLEEAVKVLQAATCVVVRLYQSGAVNKNKRKT